jgi:hypothetical protein
VKKTTIVRTIVALAFPTRVVALIDQAKAVVQGLTGNQSLSQPDPSISNLNTAIADLEAAQLAVHARTPGAVATRDAKRAALVALLRRLKTYVQHVVDGVTPEQAVALIHSVGMGVKRVPVHGKQVFSVKHGKVSGSVAIEAPSVRAHTAYEWESSSDGGKTWLPLPPTTRSKTVVTGLQPGASYSFRSRAVVKSGPTDWTQPLAIVAL